MKKAKNFADLNDEEYFFLLSEEEEINIEKNNYSADISDLAIKSIQMKPNESNEEIFYQYSWRRENVAYYKCVSSKCKGRAKANIEIDVSNKTWKLILFTVLWNKWLNLLNL